MAPFVRVWFDDGQVRVEGDGERLGLAGRDAARRSFVVAAADYARLRREAARQGLAVDDEVAPLLARHRGRPGRRREAPPVTLDLLEALDAVDAGVVRLPPGREREALVALIASTTATGTLLVCADDTAARAWRAGLLGWLDGATGEPTVAALPRAVELLRRAGDRFGLVVVDDGENLDPTRLGLALARAVAPHRIALTAPLVPGASEPSGAPRTVGVSEPPADASELPAAASEPPAGASEPPTGARTGEPSMVDLATWPVVGAWTPGAGTQAGWLRLAVPLDEDEAREVAAARRRDDDGRWLAALTMLTRGQRDKVRELIGRHASEAVAVATPARPGLVRPGLGALLDDLPLPARGALQARDRDGTLRFGALDDVAGWATGCEVIIAVSDRSSRAMTEVPGARLVVELTTSTERDEWS